MELSKKQVDDIWRICDTNPEYAVAIMTTFYDFLGIVSKKHFGEVYFMNKRTVQRNCKNGKIPTFEDKPIIKLYESRQRDKRIS
jgi:hypothetical protein